jgi:hypothetical protein
MVNLYVTLYNAMRQLVHFLAAWCICKCIENSDSPFQCVQTHLNASSGSGMIEGTGADGSWRQMRGVGCTFGRLTHKSMCLCPSECVTHIEAYGNFGCKG